MSPPHAGFDLVLEPDGRGRHHQRYALRFSTYSELEGDFKTIEGEYYRSLEVREGDAGPLLVVSPILAGHAAGYLSCRIFSRWACEEGMSAFFLYQSGRILREQRDGLDLERLFREDLRDNLKALDLLVSRPEIDERKLGTFGISMGAIKNVILIGAEPRFVANVLCLAGADLPSILVDSRENGVIRYRSRRMAYEGLTAEDIAADVRENVLLEPARLAEQIDNRRVLLFLGSLDDKVPYRNGLLLKEKLGHPETYIIPLGHYTGILAAPYAAARGFPYLRRRFDAVR